MQKEININNKIRAQKILLIDENGQNVGIFKTQDALFRAKTAGLDLVEVSAGQNGMPVCKILDYGKWKYEQTKQIKKQKSQIKKQEVKEIKFRPNTGDNDLRYRAKHAGEFLSEGHKIKLVVRFRGREQEHMFETGKALLEKFMSMMEVEYEIEDMAKVENGAIVLLLGSKK